MMKYPIDIDRLEAQKKARGEIARIRGIPEEQPKPPKPYPGQFKRKFTDEQLQEALLKGLPLQEIAAQLGVSISTVQERIKKIDKILELGTEKRSRIIGLQPTQIADLSQSHLDTAAQLQQINRKALFVLNRAIAANRKYDPATAIRAMAEVRQQLDLQLSIFSKLYDLQATAQFQKITLEEIGKARCPKCNAELEVRQEIIRRLKEVRGARRATTP